MESIKLLEKERVEKKYALAMEKLLTLESAFIIETEPSYKYKLSTQVEEIKDLLTQVKKELYDLNIDIANSSKLTPFSEIDDDTYTIGIDVGTTKVAVGMVQFPNKNKKEPIIICAKREEQDQIKDEAGIIEKICELIADILKETRQSQNKIKYVGIGLPGPVDFCTQTLKTSPGLQLDKHFSHKLIQTLIGKGFNNVYIDNDVNCATLAELYYGYGRQYKNFVCVLVGTGIGSGIVIDNKLIRGAFYSTGEVGHMRIDCSENSRKCNCGNSGCFEEYASTRAIVRRAREIILEEVIDRKRECPLTKFSSYLSEIKPKHIVDALDYKGIENDHVYNSIIYDTLKYLGIGLANIANIINPEVIVIGGGIIDGLMNMKHYNTDRILRHEYNKNLFKGTDDTVYKVSGFPKYTLSDSQPPINPAPILGAGLLGWNWELLYGPPPVHQNQTR